VAVAIGIFSRSNRLDFDLAAVNEQLAVLGVAMLAGSLLTVIAIARRSTAAWSPYVLALTSGALVLFIALVAEPVAEPLKPIPPIARTIDAARKPGDSVAIGGVSGGNGLIFYTAPPGARHKNNAGFVSTVCVAGDHWVRRSPAGRRTARRPRALAPAHRANRDADPERAAPKCRAAARRRPRLRARLTPRCVGGRGSSGRRSLRNARLTQYTTPVPPGKIRFHAVSRRSRPSQVF